MQNIWVLKISGKNSLGGWWVGWTNNLSGGSRSAAPAWNYCEKISLSHFCKPTTFTIDDNIQQKKKKKKLTAFSLIRRYAWMTCGFRTIWVRRTRLPELSTRVRVMTKIFPPFSEGLTKKSKSCYITGIRWGYRTVLDIHISRHLANDLFRSTLGRLTYFIPLWLT